jgi:ABC-2 type transport system ATP-binding protein
LDEPTSGVDPLSRRAFWDLIYELAGQGVTVFVTTHYMEEAEYCDRLGLIYRGELIAEGSPEKLKTQLMQEQIVEVQCERPQDAMEFLCEAEGVKGVALFGKGLHIVVDHVQEMVPIISGVLKKRGLAVSRVESITPSLEDVFVSLIEARDRQEQPQTEVKH